MDDNKIADVASGCDLIRIDDYFHFCFNFFLNSSIISFFCRAWYFIEATYSYCRWKNGDKPGSKVTMATVNSDTMLSTC